MAQKPLGFLKLPTVHAAMLRAWQESQPGSSGGHEEGGFILRDAVGNLSVERWPRGLQDIITVPPHPQSKLGEKDIVASFHTHPNTGSDYLQEPSETDKRAVRDDPDLKGKFYIGEFVIAWRYVYLIRRSGQVDVLGETQNILIPEVKE